MDSEMKSALIVLILLAGCDDKPANSPPPPPSTGPASRGESALFRKFGGEAEYVPAPDGMYAVSVNGLWFITGTEAVQVKVDDLFPKVITTPTGDYAIGLNAIWKLDGAIATEVKEIDSPGKLKR